MGGLVSFYLLKFSTDVLLIAPGVMGLIFGASRIWDAVSDPLAGYWSDRTRSRWGRRRPWLALAALPLGIAFVGVWAPPRGLSGPQLAAWMAAGVMLYFSAQTALAVPHASLGAELSADHHERTRIFAGRMLFEVTGFFLASAGLYLLERTADARAVAGWLALAASLGTLALTVASAARVRERPEHQGRGGRSPYASFGDVFRNPHARLLLGVFFLETLGFTTMITALPFATQYVLEMQGQASILLGSAVVVMVASVPLWLRLSRRLGKRNLYLATLALRAVAFGAMFLTPPGAWLPTLLGVIAIGSAYAGGNMLGPSMKADVIDYDEYRTGERKEGAYFATWSFAMKSGAGAAVALTGFALELGGFRANLEQTADAALAIRGLFAGAPCLCYALAAGSLLRFQLDERSHAALQAAIAERARAGRRVRPSVVP